VEDVDVYGEEYMKYDCTSIGRALVLSKLEEATMSEESFKDAKCSYVDATGAFEKMMGDVIKIWKNHLHNVELESWKKLKENDDTLNIVFGLVYANLYGNRGGS
jgi:hypothetical protein